MTENAVMITLRSGKQVASPVKQQSARKETMARQSSDDGNKGGNGTAKVAYDVVSHLKSIPARLSIYDALRMSEEFRQSLIRAVSDHDVRE
ncbi:hypothetical protein PJP10_31620, partial [Mycobacterium kansasii]